MKDNPDVSFDQILMNWVKLGGYFIYSFSNLVSMLLDKWFTELRLIFQLFIASHNVVNKFRLASFTCFQSHVFYWLWNKVTLWHVYCERQSRQWKVEESNWILWIFCRRTVLPTFVQEILRQRRRKKSFFF